MKPDVYMIGMIDNDISMYYRKECIDSWTEKGYNVIHFEAKTPPEIEGLNILNFTKKHSMRNKRWVEFTPTEKAVWYSHFFAWQKCWTMQKPMIVIEHDIKLVRDLPEEMYDYKMSCFACDVRPNGKKARLAGGGYYITPEAARQLSFVKNDHKVIYNSDAWIHSRCDKLGKWFDACAEQFKNEEIGFTIEHNH